ncbi:MAG: glycosyltransferase [Fimbriimonadaceae bacterium]
MEQVEFERWAVVAHKDFTGFGRQADMLKRALGIRRHIVIPSLRLVDRPLEGQWETLLRPDDGVTMVEEALSGCQGIIFFERCEWHPELMATAKRLGVKAVCVINWEWFKADPVWNEVDLLACPSEWTLNVVRSFGYRNACQLVWPVDLDHLPARTISGPGRAFFHNAGLVDPQDRKGTRDTIRAFRRSRRADITLVVRLQEDAPLPALDERIELRVGNVADPAELYRDGDVAIQPSKMEGIGFMVLEPWCCGIPVITTDYPPMSEYVGEPRLRVKPRWGKRRAFPTVWIPNAHLRLPQTGDLTRRIEWCADNDLGDISRAARAWAERTFGRETVRSAWESALQAVLTGR